MAGHPWNRTITLQFRSASNGSFFDTAHNVTGYHSTKKRLNSYWFFPFINWKTTVLQISIWKIKAATYAYDRMTGSKSKPKKIFLNIFLFMLIIALSKICLFGVYFTQARNNNVKHNLQNHVLHLVSKQKQYNDFLGGRDCGQKCLRKVITTVANPVQNMQVNLYFINEMYSYVSGCLDCCWWLVHLHYI